MENKSEPALDVFIEQLVEIVPRSRENISAQSDLLSDLGFDSVAFGRLAVLLYEQYGIAGLSTASFRSRERLTVEGFFNRYVLAVLGR